MISSLQIKVESVGLRITGYGSVAAQAIAILAKSFSGLVGEKDFHKDNEIHVFVGKKIPSVFRINHRSTKIFSNSTVSVFGLGKKRFCDYGDVQAVTMTGKRGRYFWVAGCDVCSLHEIVHTILLSALGEDLDIRRIHRLHALGLSYQNSSIIILAPSGVGKSSLAVYDATVEKKFQLFSDESPLLRKNKLLPFPFRIALIPEVARKFSVEEAARFKRRNYKEKVLYDFPIELKANPSVISKIFFAKKGSKLPKIVRMGRLESLCRLSYNLVLGIGLVQMAEWMLRPGDFFRLAKIFIYRLSASFNLWRSTKYFYSFSMSPDAKLNHALLLQKLDKN